VENAILQKNEGLKHLLVYNTDTLWNVFEVCKVVMCSLKASYDSVKF
jgi:hypothetical protein